MNTSNIYPINLQFIVFFHFSIISNLPENQKYYVKP
jgi:hypothetical protein